MNDVFYRELDPRDLPLVAQELDHTCGAACFASMYQLVFGESFGEHYFAEKLATLTLGYTPPEHIVELARSYGLEADMRIDCDMSDIRQAMRHAHIVFVTWWFDDAGHYSLLRRLTDDTLTLMDPWAARKGLDTVMHLDAFVPLWRQRGSRLIEVRVHGGIHSKKT